MTAMIARIEQIESEVKAVATSRRDKEMEITTLQSREQHFNERMTAFRTIADAIDVAAAEVRREKITGIQTALDHARDTAEAARKAHTGILTVTAEAARQDTIIRQATDVMAQVDGELPADTARRDEARRSLELSRAAQGEEAETLRLKLQDGQPCPVCGATEHSVTNVNRLLKDRVAADRRRVAELEEKVSGSQQARARAETRIADANAALQEIARRKSTCEVELQTASDRWRLSVDAVLQSCGEIGAIVPPFAEDAAAAGAAKTIAPFREMMNRLLGEVQETLKRAVDAETEARKLDAEREHVRTDLATATEDIVKFTAQEHAKANELGTLNATLQGREQNHAAVCSRLDSAHAPVFPDWREKVTTSGATFGEVCRDLVEQWRKCRARLEISSAEISRLEAELEGKQATLKAVEAAVAEAETQYGDKRDEFDGLASERLKVIGGRPVGEVRTEYRERSEAAEKAWNDAEITRSNVEQVVAARSSATGGARRACDAARTDHACAERGLAEKLTACEINREQAEAAITKGETWIAAEQSRLDTLREAVATARATLNERQQSAQEHEAVGRPEQTCEEIAAALTDIEVPRAKASEDFIAASSVIRNDDQVRSRMAHIKVALDERWDKARVWSQLDELIGSADGAKFRRFAQSLTLNHLLHLANRHLMDLHPRYELQRAPGSDLTLQVIDHNMADEVRGVHNLSGGERFLVSLALALGLASMSSNRGLKVESLFIDEGFGALDSTNLAMAVSVLEQLQATGRQVGVISHVDELKERIAVKVEVTPVGGGRSTVKVVTA
jgi:exonuclease SbcC